LGLYSDVVVCRKVAGPSPILAPQGHWGQGPSQTDRPEDFSGLSIQALTVIRRVSRWPDSASPAFSREEPAAGGRRRENLSRKSEKKKEKKKNSGPQALGNYFSGLTPNHARSAHDEEYRAELRKRFEWRMDAEAWPWGRSSSAIRIRRPHCPSKTPPQPLEPGSVGSVRDWIVTEGAKQGRAQNARRRFHAIRKSENWGCCLHPTPPSRGDTSARGKEPLDIGQ